MLLLSDLLSLLNDKRENADTANEVCVFYISDDSSDWHDPDENKDSLSIMCLYVWDNIGPWRVYLDLFCSDVSDVLNLC